jgi:predicted P-loop ATPase
MRPACQVDEAVVLEGPQGSLKSSALRVIGGEYFKELTANPNSKDFEQQLLGVWLGEFAELDALRRTEITKVKQFLTNREDHIRLPYGRAFVDLPRRIVFCGSTNNVEWLDDPTGGRRFIPVKVAKVNLAWLRENRDQLFAEAVHLFTAGRAWWIYPKEDTIAEQDQRIVEDPWSLKIVEWLCGRAEVTTADILSKALHLRVRDQTKSLSTRAGIALGRLGCTVRPRCRVSGKLARPWLVPEHFASQKIRVEDYCFDMDEEFPALVPRPRKTATLDLSAFDGPVTAKNGSGHANGRAEASDEQLLIEQLGAVSPEDAAKLVRGNLKTAKQIAGATVDALVHLGVHRVQATALLRTAARVAKGT